MECIGRLDEMRAVRKLPKSITLDGNPDLWVGGMGIESGPKRFGCQWECSDFGFACLRVSPTLEPVLRLDEMPGLSKWLK
jgi:hypothetical protein